MAGTPTIPPMQDFADDGVVLLAPEEETVPESAEHQRLVDLLYAGLAARYRDAEDVAVHCRLAWFPDRDDTRVRLDPDVMVVFGRPPGRRKSYRTWAEEGVAPTVLVEVLSEEDTDAEYDRRLRRARASGVAEVVLVAPSAPGGVRVEHLLPDPDDQERFRTVAVSVSPDEPVRVEGLGITCAGGRDLVVADEAGVWPDTPSAMAMARRAEAESARAEAEAQAEALVEAHTRRREVQKKSRDESFPRHLRRVEEIVEGRMRRQRIWDRPDPPKVHSIVNEAVLLAPTGGVEVMVEQLDKLIELVESHRLGLQIVPLKTGFHPGHTGMLVLMSFNSQPDTLYLENALSGSMYHGPEVEEAHELFGELLGVAWSPEVSLERLRTIRKEHECATVIRFLIRTHTSIRWPKPWSPTSIPPSEDGSRSGRASRFPFGPAGPARARS